MFHDPERERRLSGIVGCAQSLARNPAGRAALLEDERSSVLVLRGWSKLIQFTTAQGSVSGIRLRVAQQAEL